MIRLGKYNRLTAFRETDFGWYIFFIDDITNKSDLGDNLRAQAVETLTEYARQDKLDQLITQVEDLLAEGNLLEEISQQTGLELIKVDAVDQNGIRIDGSFEVKLPTIDGLLSQAFVRLPEDDLELVESETGYYLVAVDQIIDSKVRPFEEVETAINDAWKANKQQEAAKAIADSFLNKLSEDGYQDHSLESLYKNFDHTNYSSINIARDDGGDKVIPIIQDTIFKQEVGKHGLIDAPDGDGYLIIRVVDKMIPDQDFGLLEQPNFVARMRADYQQVIMNDYMDYLNNSLPIVIYDGAVRNANDELIKTEEQQGG